jgi:hypothetical protein
MAKKNLALTLILSLLVSVLAGTLLMQNEGKTFIVHGQSTNGVTTTFRGNIKNVSISLLSPENKTYNVNNLTLAFTADTGGLPQMSASGGGLQYRIGANLDYNTSSIPGTLSSQYFPEPSLPLSVPASYSRGNITFALTNLSEGSHHVTVWIVVYAMALGFGIEVGDCISTVSFTIDSVPPKVVILSPQATSYNESSVPLNFLVNKTTSEMQYSLDGQENVTITGNSTLTDLSNGRHNVTVYATDEAGNTGNQTLNFTVEKPQMFGNVLIVAVIAVPVAAVCLIAGLILYRRQQMTKNK